MIRWRVTADSLSRLARAVSVGASAWLVTACGQSATEFARHEAAAERAYSAGRYEEAATAWNEAVRTAKNPSERDEARYRRAASLERAGNVPGARAAFDDLLRATPKSPRAARAAYDRAVLLLEHGDADAGYHEIDSVIRTYPASGIAPGALRRYLEGLSPRGEDAIRNYLDTLGAVGDTELGQFIGFAYAESLERSGSLEAARDRFLLVADRYPYPGPLWDDALWNAAQLEDRLGAPRAAIEHLERLVRARETSYFQGSYEKTRYAEAEFKIAELYRDRLSDPARSRETFERLWANHPQSRLRDDAKWNAALLAVSLGDGAAACKDLETLVAAIPTSRYAACATHLCPTLSGVSNREPCHDYVVRRGSEKE